MSFKERNMYQGFLIVLLGLSEPQDIYKLGQVFAEIEQATASCPKPFDVVQKFQES